MSKDINDLKKIPMPLYFSKTEHDYLREICEEYDASMAGIIRAHINAAKKSDYLSMELDNARGTKKHKIMKRSLMVVSG